MRPEEAKKLLGLAGDDFDNGEILAAYHTAVRAAHPDSAGLAVSGITIAQLQQARAVLWRKDTDSVNHDTDKTCKLCHGVGIVRSRIGASRCVACKGTGEAR